MIGSLNLAASFILVERLAIAFGMGAAEEALVPFLEQMPLLMADQHDAMIADAGKAGADGPVVAEGPVAVQFDEVVEDHADVVDGLRPLRMAGHEDGVPGGEVVVDLANEARQLAANAANLLAGLALRIGWLSSRFSTASSSWMSFSNGRYLVGVDIATVAPIPSLRERI